MQDKYNGERILVFEKRILDQIGSFEGLNRNFEDYLDSILDKRNNHFHLRMEAEQDESLKQIIPYVLFVCGDEVFSYVRGKQAGESRLVGDRSVGIGGHINPHDEMLFAGASVASDRQTYLEAVQREIDEEVEVGCPYEPVITALINDNSNPVGRVHFGLVHIARIKEKQVKKRERQITRSGFLPISELQGPRREELESWSALCVDLLYEV